MAITYPISFAAQLRQHLRALRKKRGLTQAQLGAMVGVSQVRIAEIEANPGLVSFDQLMQLLSILGVSISLSDPHETRSRNMIANEAGCGLGSSEELSKLASAAGLGLSSSEELRKLASTAGLGLSSSEELRKLASTAGLGLGSSEELRKLASTAGLGLGSSEELRKLASATGLGIGKLKKGSW
jgi:transcriptional regulator with XRE-family HTH domain